MCTSWTCNRRSKQSVHRRSNEPGCPRRKATGELTGGLDHRLGDRPFFTEEGAEVTEGAAIVIGNLKNKVPSVSSAVKSFHCKGAEKCITPSVRGFVSAIDLGTLTIVASQGSGSSGHSAMIRDSPPPAELLCHSGQAPISTKKA